ncbi:MAG: TRAP transporter small permease subunit [Paracoccus sp. (in: a-proteobacteria)]|uniref:TRAP transporter small permease n=1 Tax=Paracoccus sp. TaxID=267 RepID=UPI0026E0AC9D|nr:TRAP transporter small permease subunit [Paracoccus sp. (in: a-proteobacteria)]MDO5622752.1 TRAP transporter small permease subunit [Paracoccus sp. (in: a-proteobacteria)]
MMARLDRLVARIEAGLGALLVAAILVLLLANVVSRGIGRPLIWTDELAVHLMAWLAFLGASLGIAGRNHMAIGILPDRLDPRARATLRVVVTLLVVAFLAVMLMLCWLWLDPAGLIRAGSGAALAAETFNFVYTDPTQTLGIRKIWFWLIVPTSMTAAMLHALTALRADLAVLRAT